MDLLPWRFQSRDQQGRDLQPFFFNIKAETDF